MPLRLYNTLTRQKVPFEPLDPSSVRLYACGPTVYDHLHIGNGRMLIVFDVLFRLLRHVYGEAHVKYVRNITDVDDKINARAAERGVAIRVLTDEMTKVFHEDAKALGCLAPTVEPRATGHVAEMIALIEKLIAKGHAYVAEGHVLFDVPSMPAYGKLSKRPLDEMIAGARVEVAPYKRGPMDFVLWKPSSASEPGWESPWGRGRPGWHIECSAMSWKHLGEVFDIHGGGIDLLFPHHENEMAQSCSAFGRNVMANVWMHNGHLQVEGEKMAKSLGNFVTIRELLHTDAFGGRSWPGEVLRLAILKTHYRQPVDFTVRALEEARSELKSWANQLAHTDAMNLSIGQRGCGNPPMPSEEVLASLLDDLNTPKALTELRSIFSRLLNGDVTARYSLIQSCEFLGLLRADRLSIYSDPVGTGEAAISPDQYQYIEEIQTAIANDNHERKEELITNLAHWGVKVVAQEYGAASYEVMGDAGLDVKALIDTRNAARAAKNWAEADRIRDELAKKGITLQDHEDASTTAHVYLSARGQAGATGRAGVSLEVKK
jgi:cysteinyl-tRNA synthetase